MLLIGVLKMIDLPGWIVSILWANFVVGVLFALLAMIGCIGTDRSNEIYQAQSDGYQLTKGDYAQLGRYEKRNKAFSYHILLCLALGFPGWRIAVRFMPIPEE